MSLLKRDVHEPEVIDRPGLPCNGTVVVVHAW